VPDWLKNPNLCEYSKNDWVRNFTASRRREPCTHAFPNFLLLHRCFSASAQQLHSSPVLCLVSTRSHKTSSFLAPAQTDSYCPLHMSSESFSAAIGHADSSTSRRPFRGSGSGSGRYNSSRGPRRGGYSSSRGGTNHVGQTEPSESTDWAAAEAEPSDTSEEVAQLKAKYENQLDVLRDIFPDWTTEDLLFVLQEADGDIETATGRIASGHTFCLLC
jgi:CUE domain